MFNKTMTSINPEFQHFCKNRDVVFFFGAGFSADLGLPTMKCFQDASKIEFELLSKEDITKKPGVQLFLDSYKFYANFRERVGRAKKFINVDPDNIEDIFCIAEAFLNSGVLALEFNGKKWHLEDVYQHIGFWLWKIYQQCPSLDVRKRKEKEGVLYEDFFAYLKEHMFERMSIITTNYDLVCEYYMNKNQIRIFYPFSNSEFQDVCLRDQGDFFVEPRATFDGVPLCKLHGSVNYFENNGSFFINREIAEKGEVYGGSRIPSRRPLMLALGALAEIKSKLNLLKIGVVPPTYSKLENKKWLRYTWNGAFELIKKAKKIVFVGYSFPSSDGFMKAMLQAALSLKEEGGELEVFVIDKNKDVFERLKKDYFINNKSVEFFEGTFTDLWKKGTLRNELKKF